MHIAFLTTEYPCKASVKTGGIGTTIRNQAALLLQSKVKVSVLLWTKHAFDDYEEDGVSIYCVTQANGGGVLSILRQQRDLGRKVSALCREHSIDLVETNDWEGNTAFAGIDVPVVLRFGGANLLFGKLLNKKVPLALGILERLAVHRADAYVGVSEQSYNVSERIFHFNKSKPSTIIYNPVDLDRVASFCGKARPGKRIVFYGTLVEKKGVLLIPKVFNEVVRRHPDATLTMIGKDTNYMGGSMKAHIEAMFSSEARARVRIISHLAYDDLLRAVANHDICLLPSYAETFGLVLLEGMALKKAVVCSDIEPFMEIARDGIDCIHCHSGDSAAFTKAVLEVIEVPGRYLSLAEEASKRAFVKFAPRKLAQQHIDFYNQVLEKCRKS
ncbi:MAG: glycosyltransferase family 4 protein [Muribaculaceae bacterium]|nr:glycosyltransferase family 4 protein [Muribaculaceae bacterium]